MKWTRVAIKRLNKKVHFSFDVIYETCHRALVIQTNIVKFYKDVDVSSLPANLMISDSGYENLKPVVLTPICSTEGGKGEITATYYTPHPTSASIPVYDGETLTGTFKTITAVSDVDSVRVGYGTY